jgi:hypothetical protein
MREREKREEGRGGEHATVDFMYMYVCMKAYMYYLEVCLSPAPSPGR